MSGRKDRAPFEATPQSRMAGFPPRANALQGRRSLLRFEPEKRLVWIL